MKMTLQDIADQIGGSLIGDASVTISALKPIDDAGEHDLTFIASAKYVKKLQTTRAAAILVLPDVQAPGRNLIACKDPYSAFGRLMALFYPIDHGKQGISPQAVIEEGAVVSDQAVVYPNCFIGAGARVEAGAVIYPGVFVGRNAVIGEDSVLYANVSVYRGCVIGRRVILHSGVVIGADGFGFAEPGVGNVKIPQVGIVRIEDDVEIGANSTVDRATMGETHIGRNVKIDNLVQIAHNVAIGEHSAIAAQTGISGSTTIGKSVMIGGQVGIVGHIRIGDRVMIGAASNVHKDIPAGQVGGGSPFLPYREWLKVEVTKAKIPAMRSQLEKLLQRVEQIEAQLKK